MKKIKIDKRHEYLTNGKQILRLGLCLPNATEYNRSPGYHWLNSKLYPRLKTDNLAARKTIYSSWFEEGSELQDFIPITRRLIAPDILEALKD